MPDVTPGDLFESWQVADKENKTESISRKLMALLNVEDAPNEIQQKVMQLSQYYSLKLKTRWEKCNRIRPRFLKSNEDWLKHKISLPEVIRLYLVKKSNFCEPGPSRGRPQKTFEEVSDRTKRRRVDDLVMTRSTAELKFAAEVSSQLSENGNRSEKKLTVEKALALYLDLDLSERKYAILRNVINALHNECFPSIHQLKIFKKSLLPDNILVTDSIVEVGLQTLLNNTACSIMKIVNDEQILSENELTLKCKWGFDGSSGHSLYKQKFSDSHSSDASLFVTAFVPLQLIDYNTGNILWINRRASSTFFCRPIRLAYVKEDKQVVKNEEQRMNTSISNLVVFQMSQAGKIINISFEMLFTMLDGSAINTLSGTNAAQNCYICGAKPSEMNEVSIAAKVSNPEAYSYGLSSLHCWIRCFECLIHISYRLPFKTWQVRGAEKKAAFEERKKNIQSEFRSKMGLLVDVVKQGFGCTNDGNTARKFFANARLSSEITGINLELIENFSLILRIIASGSAIHLDNFFILITETRNLYLKYYSWYYMPVTVHKLLLHGKDVISFFDLPIGILSEEALEARHKEIRKHRLHHTRKTSRKDTNKDLINILLLTSDPFISSLRNTSTKKSIKFDDNVSKYLIPVEKKSSHLYGQLDLNDIGDTDSD